MQRNSHPRMAVLPAASAAPPLAVTRHTPYEDLPQFLSVEEFRAFIGIGRSTVYDLLRREELPCVRFGRVVRIPRDALRPYLRLGENEKGTSDAQK